MRNFDINEAKAGKPVCTRSGRKARIICFDAKTSVDDNTYIITLVTGNDGYESICAHDSRGKCMYWSDTEHDLMMCEDAVDLPKSWEEFCKNYPIENDEHYLSEDAIISQRFDGYRDAEIDKILFRTKEQAEAMLAFIQLIRLRDVYRQGWEPDWDDATPKYCIRNFSGVIAEETTQAWGCPLSFQSEEICNTYLKNFSNLIETAKEFL